MMEPEAIDGQRRYAWAQVYEARRTIEDLKAELENAQRRATTNFRDKLDLKAELHRATATLCIECDERPVVVDGMCHPCLHRHYHGDA